MHQIFLLLLLLVISGQSYAIKTEVSDEVNKKTHSKLISLVNQLPKTKLRNMAPLIKQISLTKKPLTRNVLQFMLDGDLYFLKANKQLVRAQVAANNLYQLTDVLTAEPMPEVKKSRISKIKTNNSLRSTLRSMIAKIDLTDENKQVRLQAVQQLLSSPSKKTTAIITELIDNEQDEDVKALMATTVALQQLKDGDVDEKIAALKQLNGSLEPTVKNQVVKLLANLPEKERSAEQQILKEALGTTLQEIENRASFYSLLETVFFGLSLGSVLLLAAIGLAITFGVMGVINMAHGEMIMLGAYTTYVIQLAFPSMIEYSLLIAVPAAFIVSGSVGVIIERGVIRFLKGRPLETLLATFGISLILQQLVRTIFSPLNRQVISPEWMSGSWQINPIFSLTFNRLYIIIFSIFVFISLLMILKKTSLGLHVRAVSQNRDMARALSIKSDWVDAITFGLGSGIAGVAGVVLSQLTNVGPNLGQAYIIDSFLVVVFGGVGNLWGTLVAAMSLGLTNKFLEPVTGTVLANIIVLVGLVLFIQKRPKGLFPQKGRSTD
ncbi:urea ABC transporter permease subunit UrtB [Paraglaciecola psychrophila]|jgi:urea transport system permease protein|uniref:Branched-chain amino acid ABC transporter permease n=1 Tax=Paraglaciecola psychrophila 170 TaxID=1129794 RepID=K7ANL2_9ALTE|nr:urea ABC transporter permease subunit UrtB [Paraglaciecola psychrophila]AGH47645.1 branched-chain amino acid ABC transporter permease [Paraglaciecola psychrophila 170]GAC36915.1 branched-chain amino acid transport system permease protein [Paraglaciecola psychrophila 170]